MCMCPPLPPAVCIRRPGLLFPTLLAAGEGVAEWLEKHWRHRIGPDAVVALSDVEELRGAVLMVGAKVVGSDGHLAAIGALVLRFRFLRGRFRTSFERDVRQ